MDIYFYLRVFIWSTMTLHSYITGFVLSLMLTALAFGLAWLHLITTHTFPSHEIMIFGLVALALAQLFVQLKFFLHVGKESKEWINSALAFALIIVVILVGGTLWIMNNLQHSPNTPFGGSPSPQTEL
jgi:cytochrome o ubiquinol oxidase subunit IV